MAAGLPKYFFVIRWRDREHDVDTGTRLASDKAALQYAVRIIRELKKGNGYDQRGLQIVVQNEDRRTIFVVPF